MRLILSVATVAAIGLSSSADAADKDVAAVPAPAANSPAPVPQVATTRPVYRPVRTTSDGLFGRVMELERRKNAWLRSTFLQ
jgi:hypothetical protein